ncbi:MAG: hypothetical protein AAF492_07110, partial [Verrucomicrobiota bacterium]
MRVAQQDATLGNTRRMIQRLYRDRSKPGTTDLRGWEWYYLYGWCRPDEHTIRGHSQKIRDVVWGPEGKKLLSVSLAHLLMHDGETGEELWGKETHNIGSAAAWSRDGTRLAVGGPQDHIQIRRATDGALIHTYRISDTFPVDLAWSPDDRTLAVLGARVLALLDLKSAQVREVARITRSQRGLGWTPDGKNLYAQCRFYDLESGASRTLDTKGAPFVSRLSADASRVAVATQNSRLLVFDAATGALLNETHLEGRLASLAWSGDGRFIAAGSGGLAIRIFRTDTLAIHRTLYGHVNTVVCLGWSADGARLASGGHGDVVKIWGQPDSAGSGEAYTQVETRLREGLHLPEEPWPELPENATRSLSPDGRLLVVTQLSRLDRRTGHPVPIGIWDTGSRTLRHAVSGHDWRNGPGPARWSADSRLFATGGADHVLILWDPETGLALHRLEGHNAAITAYAFAPDGTRLASRDRLGAIKVWAVETGAEVLSFQVEANRATQEYLGWSPDGMSLIGHPEHGEIWSAEKGYERAAAGELELDYRMAKGSRLRYPGLSADTPDLYLEAAARELFEGRFGRITAKFADIYAGEAVALDPTLPEAWVIWGAALEKSEKWLEAAKKIDRAEQLGFGTMKAEALGVRAVLAFKNGDSASGDRWLADARRVHPASTLPTLAERWLWRAEREKLDRLEKQKQTEPAQQRRLAELRLLLGDLHSGFGLLAENVNPDDASALLEPFFDGSSWSDLDAFLHVALKSRRTKNAALLDRIETLLKVKMDQEENGSLWGNRFTEFRLTRVWPWCSMVEDPEARRLLLARFDNDAVLFDRLLAEHPEAALEAGFQFYHVKNLEPAQACFTRYLE